MTQTLKDELCLEFGSLMHYIQQEGDYFEKNAILVKMAAIATLLDIDITNMVRENGIWKEFIYKGRFSYYIEGVKFYM